MRLLVWTVCLVLGASSAPSTLHAAGSAEPLIRRSLSTSTVLANGKRLQVVVTQGEYWEGVPYRPALFWGAEVTKPGVVVKAIDLSIDAKDVPLWLPFSAYADLAEPKTVALAPSSHGIDIVLEGGGTSTGYRAVLTVARQPDGDGYLIRRRRVFLRTFPAEVFEESTYSWNTTER